MSAKVTLFFTTETPARRVAQLLRELQACADNDSMTAEATLVQLQQNLCGELREVDAIKVSLPLSIRRRHKQ